MEDGRSRISVEAIVSSSLASPTLAKRVKELDANNDGVLSVEELLRAVRMEQDLVVQRRLLVRIIIALGIGLLLTIAAVVGLTYAVVDLSKETTVNHNNVLEGKSSKSTVGTGMALRSAPINQWLTKNMTLMDFHGLEAVGIKTNDSHVQYHRVSSVEQMMGEERTIAVHLHESFKKVVLTPDGVELHGFNDDLPSQRLRHDHCFLNPDAQECQMMCRYCPDLPFCLSTTSLPEQSRSIAIIDPSFLEGIGPLGM